MDGWVSSIIFSHSLGFACFLSFFHEPTFGSYNEAVIAHKVNALNLMWEVRGGALDVVLESLIR
jgi:hypothetical protein